METFICCYLVVLRLDNLQMLLDTELLKKKKKEKQKKKRKSKLHKIKIALSLGYPNSYFFNKRCNMLL